MAILALLILTVNNTEKGRQDNLKMIILIKKPTLTFLLFFPIAVDFLHFHTKNK